MYILLSGIILNDTCKVGVWPQHERGRESPNVIEFLLVTSYLPVWHYLTI